ncbi:MAG: tryptophan synthase subunit alpha [Candidatus Bathyarchaeota archaeon]|nr:tryptophan synthase subunit alpha [Candidatus Bathyarchaeota archaeon]
MSAIAQRFQKLKRYNEVALIGYVTAGDPDPVYTPKIAEALIKGGVDILELGLPFSDPIADGPTIQAASVRALNAGTKPKTVLQLAREIRSNYNVPLVVMTYYNPVFRMGLDNFFQLAKECLVDGVIIPDLPLEEAADYKKAARDFGIDTIFLVAPSTSDARIQKIVAATSGFLYVVSHFGVTGTKSTVEKSTLRLIKRISPFTAGRVPLAVGFGISQPEHVKRVVAAGADAVVVGSAFVSIIEKQQQNFKEMLSEIEETAKILKDATQSKAL